MPDLRWPLLIPIAVALVGCGVGEPAATPSTAPDPLAAFPPCGTPPAPVDATGLPPGAEVLLPDEVVVTGVTVDGPAVTVEGYAPAPPLDVRRAYERRHGVEVTLLAVEDEIVEAEVLVSDGTHRAYLTFRPACRTGSTMLGIIGPELDGTEG